MKNFHHPRLVATLLLALSACGQGDEAPAVSEPGEATVAPDRPAPAISNPQSPTPVGTDVGAVERDTSAGVLADDSMAVPGR